MRINYFDVSRDTSATVLFFFESKLNLASIKAFYADAIAVIQAKIDGVEKLRGSILWESENARIPEYEEQIHALEEKRDAAIKAEDKYTYTKADRAFMKAVDGMKKGTGVALYGAVETLLVELLGEQAKGSDTVRACVDSIGEKVTTNRLVATGGTECKAINKTEAIKAVYGQVFEEMVLAGTIKPAQIPENLRAKYEEKLAKKNEKKVKKSAKKSEKKSEGGLGLDNATGVTLDETKVA